MIMINLAWFFFLSILVLACGLRIIRLLKLKTVSAFEKAVFSLTLGLGFFSYLTFIVAVSFLGSQLYNLAKRNNWLLTGEWKFYEQNHLVKIFLKDKIMSLADFPLLTLKIIILFLVMLLSIFYCALSPKLRVVLYIILFGTLSSIFLYGINIIKGINVMQPNRAIAQVLPFLAFGVVYSLYRIFRRV